MTIGTRRLYTDKWKQEAIKRGIEQAIPRSQVARDLGIDPPTLRS